MYADMFQQFGYHKLNKVAGCCIVLFCLSASLISPIMSQAVDYPPGWVENPSDKHRAVCRGSFIWQPKPKILNSVASDDLVISAIQVVRGEDSLILSGGVEVIINNTTLHSESAIYDEKNKELMLSGEVSVSSPELIAISTSALYRSQQANQKGRNGNNGQSNREYIKLETGVFSQPGAQLHGSASSITYDNSIILLENAKVSFCDPSENIWSLSSRTMRLNLNTSQGSSRGTKFNLGNRSVMYFPYFAFPLGDRRQTGFLFPNFDFASSSGFIYLQPIYLNIAPNVDSTIYANFIQDRGFLWEQDLRWLTKAGAGELGIGYINRDASVQQERAAQYFKFSSVVNNGWSGDITWIGIDDNNYIRDLPTIIDDTNDLSLPRTAKLRYADQWVDWSLGVRDYQFIASQASGFTLPYINLPYTRLGIYTALGSGFYFDNLLDYTHFRSAKDSFVTVAADGDVIEGDNARWHNEMSLGWSGYSHWGKAQTRINWQRLDYNFNRDLLNQLQIQSQDDLEVERNNYYFDFDSSLIFSRYIRSVSCDCYWTLEPRLYALSSRQDSTEATSRFITNSKFFDTLPAVVNYDYLFNPERYQGFDNDVSEQRVSLGVESRLINLNGRGDYTFRLGQIISSSVEQSETHDYLANATDPWALDISWNFARRGYLKFDLGGLSNQADFYGLSLHYKNKRKSGVSLIYRNQQETSYQDRGHQLANNFVWYMVPRWSLFAGWRYNLDDDKFTSAVSGFGYENCCFATQLGYFQKLNAGRDERGASLSFSFIPLDSVGSSNRIGSAVISGSSIEDIYDEFK